MTQGVVMGMLRAGVHRSHLPAVGLHTEGATDCAEDAAAHTRQGGSTGKRACGAAQYSTDMHETVRLQLHTVTWLERASRLQHR
jgi:hypothetical protein